MGMKKRTRATSSPAEAPSRAVARKDGRPRRGDLGELARYRNAAPTDATTPADRGELARRLAPGKN